jgi:GAF domain-containing protein
METREGLKMSADQNWTAIMNMMLEEVGLEAAERVAAMLREEGQQ